MIYAMYVSLVLMAVGTVFCVTELIEGGVSVVSRDTLIWTFFWSGVTMIIALSSWSTR